ncbi:site-specific integrase [Sphingomonas sp. Leaf4]|uniref:site-specific integrase n=1 Tax=Sphingomonas sp. Leaf4 TaxID=2876553 RepID=UPI001E41CFE8|nr:site-specific integrase [Sphingomonas sp. Leaf4]
MCSYLHRAPNGVYYFRMGIPADLRPFMAGKREIKRSLGLKDREAAKALIPDMTKTAHALLKQAERDRDAAEKAVPVPPPPPPKTSRQIERERAVWEAEERAAEWVADDLFAADMEAERLSPVMDALASGIETDASPADLARAARLQILNEREAADALVASIRARYGQSARASIEQNQVVECEPVTGSGLYLDKDILDRWATERGVVAKGKDTHRAVSEWFYARTERKPVEQITRQDVLAFKDKLLAEGQSPTNTNVKLTRLRTLLSWAYQNDLVPSNVAAGISVKVADGSKGKRLPFTLDELQAIFASPIYSKGDRPRGGKGEAAYWLPLLALFTGARLEEIGQLRVADVQRREYPDQDGNMLAGWFLHITEETDERGQSNRLKNAASERLVPLHPELERLGFVAYVQGLKDKQGRVFPDLVANIYGRLTAKWGEWFGPYMRTVCGITDKRKVFHSFRHTFKDYARRAKMPEGIQRQLMGHTGKDVADGYGSGYDLRSLGEAMVSYRVPGLQITPSTRD